jgi:hypothetical protein
MMRSMVGVSSLKSNILEQHKTKVQPIVKEIAPSGDLFF